MAKFGVTTGDLDRFVRVIDALQRNLPALGVDRSRFDEVYVQSLGVAQADGPLQIGVAQGPARQVRKFIYNIVVDDLGDVLAKDLEKLTGVHARDVDASAPVGTRLTVNQFLESILLVHETRCAASNGIVIALFARQRDSIDLAHWHRELGRLGCRGVRLGFLAPQNQGVDVHYLIEVSKPPANFVPPSEWGTRDALVFYRLKADPSCPFYIEWGYAHPVRDLARLYRVADERMVLLAADAIGRSRGHGDRSTTSATLRLPQESWRSVFEMADQVEYSVEIADLWDPRTLEAAKDTTRVNLAVEMRRDSALGGSGAEIESKVAWHLHAVEQLRKAQQRREIERHEPVYLVQVFEQPLANPDPEGQRRERASPGSTPLPPSFVRFLDRPYTELANFQYGFYLDESRPDVGLHIVLDEHPDVYERSWASLADDCYVAPQRWWDMGLRILVRVRDTLYPRLDDDTLLARLRDELRKTGSFDADTPILLRCEKNQHETTSYSQAIGLVGLRPLIDSEVFAWLSARFEVNAATFQIATHNQLHSAQVESVARLDELANSLEQEVILAIEQRVIRAEQDWTIADQRVAVLEERFAEHRAAAEEIDALLSRHTESWVDFVDTVLEADRTLSIRKVEALDRYETDHKKRAAALAAREKALTDANKRIANDLQSLVEFRVKIDEEEGKLKSLVSDLSEKILAARDTARLLEAKIAKFDSIAGQRHAEIEKTLHSKEEEARALDAKIAQLEKATTDLEQIVAKLQNRRQAFKEARTVALTAQARIGAEREAYRASVAAAREAVDGLGIAAAGEEKDLLERMKEMLVAVKKEAGNRSEVNALAVKVQNAGVRLEPLGDEISETLLREIRKRLP
jgi:hypothetical protein